MFLQHNWFNPTISPDSLNYSPNLIKNCLSTHSTRYSNLTKSMCHIKSKETNERRNPHHDTFQVISSAFHKDRQWDDINFRYNFALNATHLSLISNWIIMQVKRGWKHEWDDVAHVCFKESSHRWCNCTGMQIWRHKPLRSHHYRHQSI